MGQGMFQGMGEVLPRSDLCLVLQPPQTVAQPQPPPNSGQPPLPVEATKASSI